MHRRKVTRRRAKQHRRKTYKGGSGSKHIYDIPLETLFETLYDLTNELFDLRSKCASSCIKKLCSPSSDPDVCDQARKMAYYNNVYEITNICNMHLVRMTDPTGAQCKTESPSANCVCDQYMKKYKELERIIADLDIFISNYHIDNHVKRYIQIIRDSAQTIRNVFDNFNMGNQLRLLPAEFKMKSINNIMQMPEFKEALRAALTVATPRPASAPSRLEVMPSSPTGLNRVAFSPKTVTKPVASKRLLNTIKHMNN